MAERTTARVKEILSWYASDSPGTLANLHRMLMTGKLGGTGKLVILPVDQGFEHGPARSFAPNPAGYDPEYHFQLAIDAGCNAYAAPLGFIEAGRAQVRRPDPAHPQAQQLRLALQDRRRAHLGGHRLGEGGGAARLRRHRLHHLPGVRRPERAVRGAPRAHRGGQGARPRRGGLELPARRRRLEGRRDRGRHRRLRRPDRRPARRAHRQGEAAEGPRRAAPRRRRSTRSSRSPRRRSPIACATWCRAPSTASASSSSPAARRRGPTRCWPRSAASKEGGAFGSIMGRNAFQRPEGRGAQAARRGHEDLRALIPGSIRLRRRAAERLPLVPRTAASRAP